MKKLMISLLVLLELAACSPQHSYHGYSFEGKNIETIKAGQTTEHQILSTFGSPTTYSDFGDKTYYYIGMRSSRKAFLERKAEEQITLEVVFDHNGLVKSVETYTLERANPIEYEEHKTKLKGNDLNPIQQILRNVGKFNAPKSKK
jgi:outer membrane protein assembly factor BamE (lipoprotein component of BamABCDE complex)